MTKELLKDILSEDTDYSVGMKVLSEKVDEKLNEVRKEAASKLFA